MKHKSTEYLFKDIAKFRYGKMPKKDKVLDIGKYPVYSGYRYVGYYDEYNTEAGQLIVVARGVGGTGDVKLTKEKCFLTNLSIAVEITANDVVIPEYLYYMFSLNNLRYLDSGSAQSQITISDLERLKITLPDASVQCEIVSILKALDDKIALNQQINKNLEEQAQAIFKAWFEDYEPFGGEAPNEFISMTLGRVAEIKTDSISPSKNPNVKVEHYSIPAYDEKHFPVFETTDDIKSNKYIITDKSVIISKLNPDTKRIWRPMCLSEHPICSTEFIVYEARNPAHKDFLYSLIDSVRFYNYLCSHTTGSTNSRQRATPSATLDFEFLLPSDEWIKKFCLIVTPIYDMISANLMENQALTNLRDALLPRLMSGEIDVSKIEV